MIGNVYTTGDPEKLLWVLGEYEGKFLCVAQSGTRRNRPVLKAFLTLLTKNDRRVQVDSDQAQEFRKRCAKYLVEILNEKIALPSVKRAILRLWK